MSCLSCFGLKHVDGIGDTMLMNELENNFKAYLDWSFLELGGFTNIEIGSTGLYNNDQSVLRLANDKSFADGRVWETARKDWIYETGISYGNNEPIDITGVMVNGVMHGTGDGAYAHYYNYPLGRVIFNSPISKTAVVKLGYSYRHIQVYKADSAEWLDFVQSDSIHSELPHFEQQKTGEWSIGGQARVQLPCIVIESVPRRASKPYELGNFSLDITQDILCHVFAESKSERNNILDFLMNQQGSTICLFKTDSILESGAYSLDYRGMVVNDNCYPDFITDYGWKKCFISRTQPSTMTTFHPKFYGGVVRVSCNLILD